MNFIKNVFKNKIILKRKKKISDENIFLKNLLESQSKVDKKEPLLSQKIVVIDTETTGFKVDLGDRVISIGAVIIENGKVNHNKTYYELVNPKRNIPENITKLTDISNSMVEKKPQLIEILSDFYTWADSYLLAGHIVEFDLSFIKHSIYQNCNIKPKLHYIDTRELITSLIPDLKRRTLEDICMYLNIPCENRHNALADAIMSAEILEFCIKELAKEHIHTLEDLDIYYKRRRLLNSRVLAHGF